MNEAFLTIIAIVTCLAGTIALFAGACAIYGALMWRYRWKAGNAKQMKMAAKLGWNTGAPPEGVYFIAYEFKDSFRKHSPNSMFFSNFGWSIMIRRGDRAQTKNGGFSTPIENVTGWIELNIPDGVMHD